MEMLTRIIEESKRRREVDAQRFKEADMDLCMCCHAYGADKRSLWVDCLYAVHELVPEAIDISGVDSEMKNHNHGYYLRICKACRGRFLRMMGEWWKAGVNRRDAPKDHDGHDRWPNAEGEIER